MTPEEEARRQEMLERNTPPGAAPEEEPDSDSQGEDEDDSPSGIAPGDAVAIGERLAATVEREALPDDDPSNEGEAPTPTGPPHDPYTETCATCDGYGVTYTGSRVDGQDFRHCIDCGGKGWRERLEAPRTIPPLPSAPPETAEAMPPGGWREWDKPAVSQ